MYRSRVWDRKLSVSLRDVRQQEMADWAMDESLERVYMAALVQQIQLMRRRSYQLDSISAPKYKYSFNNKTYDLDVSASFDNKIGAYRARENSLALPAKIKPTSNFTLDKLVGKTKTDSEVDKSNSKNNRNELKLPSLKKRQVENPQIKPVSAAIAGSFYYLGRVIKSFELKETGYLVALTRQHFLQTIQALKLSKNIKTPNPVKEIKLAKKNPKLKTVYLDLDETLIHCDENTNNYTVKLDFPVEGGNTVSAGIRVRPHCQEFLKALSTFAEIIIFTASSSSYADVVLDYLDPQKKYFSHRLYRQHCTLEQGFYTKDLRCVNRRLEDAVLVDNSGFSLMAQPQNGIPILPYYHFNKDRELLSLIDFLRDLMRCDDVRVRLKQYFFWHKYINNPDGQAKKIFIDNLKVQTK